MLYEVIYYYVGTYRTMCAYTYVNVLFEKVDIKFCVNFPLNVYGLSCRSQAFSVGDICNVHMLYITTGISISGCIVACTVLYYVGTSMCVFIYVGWCVFILVCIYNGRMV